MSVQRKRPRVNEPMNPPAATIQPAPSPVVTQYVMIEIPDGGPPSIAWVGGQPDAIIVLNALQQVSAQMTSQQLQAMRQPRPAEADSPKEPTPPADPPNENPPAE